MVHYLLIRFLLPSLENLVVEELFRILIFCCDVKN
jgi:hypothetical protein